MIFFLGPTKKGIVSHKIKRKKYIFKKQQNNTDNIIVLFFDLIKFKVLKNMVDDK